MITMDIVRFCAIECRLQMSGELSVWHMAQAWEYAMETSGQDGLSYEYAPTLEDVINIGYLVEPNVNVRTDRSEFRTVDVRVGYDIKMNWENVPRAMVGLMEGLTVEAYHPRPGITMKAMTPEKFFKEYEEIHPWRDGNGRSGVILFNWLNGTLADPVWAPNFWNDPRRTVGYGA